MYYRAIRNGENIRSLYQATIAEIARYRNIEWRNTVLFTGAIATIIGYRLGGDSVCCNHFDSSFDVFFSDAIIILMVANIYFTSYAHFKLAQNRCLQAKLEEKMSVEGFRNHPNQPINKNFLPNYCSGYWSHLFPFFLASIILAAIGLCVVGQPFWLAIIASVPLLVIFYPKCIYNLMPFFISHARDESTPFQFLRF